MDPKRTLELLNELQELGLSNEAFAQLHHFILRDKAETIASFRAYCEKRCKNNSAFKPNGTNELVHQRLALVLERYRERGLPPGNSKVLIALAKDAFREIPPH